MRYWWVNQNQTNRYEIAGGYLWSPKVNSNGARNPFYEAMRETAPGDVVFSYFGGQVAAIGLVRSFAYEAPKPIEFGVHGAYWDKIGWRVDATFFRLALPLRPSEVMDVLAPLLPGRYAPLRPNGMGLQSVYLTRLPDAFAGALIDLLGPTARAIVNQQVLQEQPSFALPAVGLQEWEDHQEDIVRSDDKMQETTRLALVQARRGQGIFKQQVGQIEKRCRVTGVDRIEYLRASHCKPWRDSNNDERLDAENGLLLTPTIDHLFDRGFIGFENNGELIVSPVAHSLSLLRMGIDVSHRKNVGSFSTGQKAYLEFHRDSVLLRSRLSAKRMDRLGTDWRTDSGTQRASSA
ncbi:MAG: HNH endonuclease signature motif containing protein [Burkholderiaceae bacterium]